MCLNPSNEFKDFKYFQNLSYVTEPGKAKNVLPKEIFSTLFDLNSLLFLKSQSGLAI